MIERFNGVDNSSLHRLQTLDIMDHKGKVDFLELNRTKEFGLRDLSRFKIFPWARNYRTIRRIVDTDLAGENILHARVEGEGQGRRYYIRGSEIIKYINKYGPALMARARKPKQYGKKNKEGGRG